MSNGILSAISFKKETTWGTAVVPDKSISVHPTGGLSTKNDQKEISNVKAMLSKVQDTFIGARTHGGEFEMNLFADYPAYFFVSAMGGVASALASGESAVYEHTITESATKTSLTIEQAIGEVVRRYAGAQATGFKLSVKTGEAAVVSFPIIAKSQATATAITPAFTNTRPFNFADIQVKIGGTSIGEVTEVEVEYKSGLTHLHTIAGTNDPGYQFLKPSEISGKISLYLDSTSVTRYTNYLSKTSESLEIIATGDAVGVAEFLGFDMTIPRCDYKTAVVPLSAEDNKLDIEFTGVYDTATNKLVSIVITNSLANLN
jgi:hypothetical protein